MKFTAQDIKNLAEAQDLIDKAYEHFADTGTGRYLLTDGLISIANGSYFDRRIGTSRLIIKVYSSVFAGTDENFAGTQELLEWAKKTYRDEMARIA